MTVQGLVKNQPIDFSRGQIFVPWKSAVFKSKDSHKFTNELKFWGAKPLLLPISGNTFFSFFLRPQFTEWLVRYSFQNIDIIFIIYFDVGSVCVNSYVFYTKALFFQQLYGYIQLPMCWIFNGQENGFQTVSKVLWNLIHLSNGSITE